MNTKSSRYQQMFTRLQDKDEIAWVPFIMLGYPTMALSIKYIETFIENGADALELGIPFSDPVADGVLIQESARVALENGSTVDGCLNAIATLRENYSEIAIGLLIYANLVYKPGINNFFQRCQTVGVDSVLIADVPLIESKPFIEAADNNQVDSIFIAPPNASNETIKTLSTLKGGYTYVVSRPGVTGDNKHVEYPEQIVKGLLSNQAPPPILGFGISKPEHVKKAIEYGFKGVISGSAISRLIIKNNDDLLTELRNFSLMMKKATTQA